ncbi:hypothetical protein BSG1_00855 [Bacillus sp. SG-1]|nr:hypothetical protein BSG1_00855 [Bacillus sp. SG-1]
MIALFRTKTDLSRVVRTTIVLRNFGLRYGGSSNNVSATPFKAVLDSKQETARITMIPNITIPTTTPAIWLYHFILLLSGAIKNSAGHNRLKALYIEFKSYINLLIDEF